MNPKYIKKDFRAGVRWIDFDRPQKLNAVNSDVLQELETVLAACEKDAQTRVVVLQTRKK